MCAVIVTIVSVNTVVQICITLDMKDNSYLYYRLNISNILLIINTLSICVMLTIFESRADSNWVFMASFRIIVSHDVNVIK